MTEKNVNRDDEQKETLDKIVQHLEEEARMILPGIQALFGFQLIAVFNQKFSEMVSADQHFHFLSLLFTTVAIAFVLSPAAYHRQAEPNKITKRFCRLGTRMLTLSLIPLIIGISLDLFVITKVITKDQTESLVVSALAFVLLTTFWFIFPQLAKARNKTQDTKERAQAMILGKV